MPKTILQIKRDENDLILYIKKRLPSFYEIVLLAKKSKVPVILNQDSFAADYQDAELVLLGTAIKFAGYHGVEVRITGKNRETL